MNNSPTYERTQKSDWEQNGKRRRRSDTLSALRSRIGDDVIADAKLWIQRWELAVNSYCDAHKNSGSTLVRGDRITFTALQAKAWQPINDFKIHAGEKKHAFLIQLLARSRSFTSLASEYYPQYASRQAHTLTVNYSVDVLTELHEFWTSQRKTSAHTKIEASRLYDSGCNLPTLCERYKLALPGMRKMIADGKRISSKPKKVLTIIS